MRVASLLSRVAVLTVFVVAVAAWSAKVAAGPVLELVHAAGSPGSTRNWTLDHLLGDLASALLLVATSGLAVMSGLAMTAAVAAPRAPTLAAACARVTPDVSRRLVAAALGLGLTAPVIVGAPVLAAGHGHVTGCRDVCRADPGHGGLGGLGFPDLPSTTATRPEQPLRQVVVHVGESLWRIAEDQLPLHTTNGEVATLTWRLYALNRSTIGDDPDLIYPAVTLIVPKGTS